MSDIDVQELKEYIIEHDKIADILDALQCHSIKDKDTYYTCGRPNGDNPQSIVVYKKDLRTIQYTGKKINGDIVALVMGLENIDFVNALKEIHSILGLEWKKQKQTKIKKINPLDIFTKQLKSRHQCNVDDVKIYNDDILTDFGDCIHSSYCNNRITEKVRKEFGLCYDFMRNRTVIPWRNQNGIVGISGRTSNPMYQELDIPKFYSYQGFKKSQCLYGFCENYAHIQEAGYVIVYESEKSVLIRASLGDRTGVAIGGSNISEEQIRMLLSLNCDIIIALDKDQPVKYVKKLCDKFVAYRQTYYMYDKWNLLGDKDSPADANNKVFNFLLKHKFRYDIGENE